MSTKATKNTKKPTTTKKASPKPTVMTYPQVKALTNALFHSHKTKAELSKAIDGLNPEGGRKMSAEKKAEWLKAHGGEPATYGQCVAYATILFKGKTSYEEASKAIAALDKKNGYVRKPKVEGVVEEANRVASETNPQQLSIFDDGNEQPQA